MKVVFDTSVLVDIERKNEDSLLLIEKLMDQNAELCISSVSIAELYVGAYMQGSKEIRIDMRKFLSAFVWIEMDHAIAEETGKLIANRLEAGKPVDFQDNVILATCIQQKADYLLTENLKHFRSKEMETKVFTTSQFLKQLKKEK